MIKAHCNSYKKKGHHSLASYDDPFLLTNQYKVANLRNDNFMQVCLQHY